LRGRREAVRKRTSFSVWTGRDSSKVSHPDCLQMLPDGILRFMVRFKCSLRSTLKPRRRGGKVRTFVVPSREADEIQPIMRANVETNSRLITDAFNSYVQLRDEYNHESIKHTKGDYVTHGDKHTNNIEGYWSILKRGIIGTFHFVSPQHLQRYCDEFAHRYNTRHTTTAEKFVEAVKGSHNARLKYRELTPNLPKKKATK
jgi:transposase-like protein